MKKLFLTAFVLLGLVLVSQAQTKHTIGEKFGGGIVFWVDETGEHGLIAETIDQSQNGARRNPKELMKKSKSSKLNEDTPGHSPEGSKFNDWRLPTNDELSKLVNLSEILELSPIHSYLTSDYKPQEVGRWSDTIVVAPMNVRKIRSF